MKSWSNWQSLTMENVRGIGGINQGVYSIRVKGEPLNGERSDIIYIGEGGSCTRNLSQRIMGLAKELTGQYEKGSNHKPGDLMREQGINDVEFSFIECEKNSTGLEKAMFLAFYVTNDALPLFNRRDARNIF